MRDHTSIFVDLRGVARSAPHVLPVGRLGYIINKSRPTRIDPERYAYYGFSFVLAGKGRLTTVGGEYAIEAPCVFRIPPAVSAVFTPTPTWDELYLLYCPAAIPALKKAGYAAPGEPLWRFRYTTLFRRILDLLLEVAGRVHEIDAADRLDRLADQLILESRLSVLTEAPADRYTVPIRAIQTRMKAAYRVDPDFRQLAREYGMSFSNFRRQWRRRFAVPPARYLIQLRLNEACRLLRETDLPIGEIAERLNFRDPLYFSRKFHQYIGQTASAFRSGGDAVWTPKKEP